ncbi:MAG: 50S ribosomal protein L10 [Candidatus Kapaibacterium sp.]
MITKKKKQEIIDEISEKLGRAKGLYFIDFTGLSVKDSADLRSLFKEKEVEFKVAKNTLLKRAIDSIDGMEVPGGKLFGPTGIAFAYDDPVVPARILKDYTVKRETPKLKSAILEGAHYDGSQLKQLAELPSREDNIAGILAALNAPVAGIAGAINATIRDLASLIEEVAKKQNAAA